MSDLNQDAATIARILQNTDTDARGNLLLMVADLLKDNTQYFTATIIEEAAMKYGWDN